MNKKLQLFERESTTWRELWETLLTHGIIEPEVLVKPWRDVSTPENRWFNIARRWLLGEFGLTRKGLVEQFIATFGDREETNTKLLAWGRCAEDLKEYYSSLN